ncbi:hypothetical protein As57867_007808, partial [Aphanomyces stellatus]
ALTTFGYSILESFDLAQCGHLEDLSIVRAKVSIRHIFRELPIGCTLVMTHATVDPCGSLSSWGSDFSALPQLLEISRAAEVAESIRLTKVLTSSGVVGSPTTGNPWPKPLSFLAHAVCCICQSEHPKMEKRCVMETTAGSGIRASKRHFCGHCLLVSPVKPPREVPQFEVEDEYAVAAELRPMALSTLSSLALSEYSMDEHQTNTCVPGKRPLPILDFDSDDEDESYSIYSGLDFDLRSTVQSHLDLDDRGSVDEATSAKVSPGVVLGFQLARLTARMDDTLSLLRRNKTQVDFCRSHGRVEYL